MARHAALSCDCSAGSCDGACLVLQTHGFLMSLDLKVIGAGLARTATTSLKLALETLLKGPCFHCLEYKWHPELMDPWRAFIETMPLPTDPDAFRSVPIAQWEKLMPGYIACVDEPASYYWKQLAEVFPEALVVLSVRDTDSWMASALSTEESYEREMKRPELISAEQRAFNEFTEAINSHLKDDFSVDAEKARFEAHNQRVLEHAERDPEFEKRLLVWRAQDGWEPLCNALDLPVPDVPFPHVNKRNEYHGY